MVAPLPLPILYVMVFLLFLSWALVSLNSIHSPLGYVNFSHSFSYQLYTEESHLNASSSELLPESKPILPTAHCLPDLHLKILLTPHLKLYRFKTDFIIFLLHQTCSSSCLHFLAQWVVITPPAAPARNEGVLMNISPSPPSHPPHPVNHQILLILSLNIFFNSSLNLHLSLHPFLPEPL